MEGRAGRPTWLFPWAQTNATWEIPRATTKGPSGFYEERLYFVTLSIRSNTQEPLCDDDQEAAAMARLTVSEGAHQQSEKPDLLIANDALTMWSLARDFVCPHNDGGRA